MKYKLEISAWVSPSTRNFKQKYICLILHKRKWIKTTELFVIIAGYFSCLKEALSCIIYNTKYKHRQWYGFSVVWYCFSEIAKYNSTRKRKLKQSKLESSDSAIAGSLQLIKRGRERCILFQEDHEIFNMCSISRL